MFEPVEVDNILIAVMSGALTVLFGALYALMFALGKLINRNELLVAAYAFFVLLAISVLFLAVSLQLGGFWQTITVTLLVGYLLAPHGIWKLCTGTHSGADESPTPAVHATGESHE